jgi:ATP-dependent exoDNAse (exonuclease V) alpha subunit
MLMTGPGGTGKTYVIEAVKKVLEHYGASHKIKCFAPTASAATLVDGSTIHKGFSIQVRKHPKNERLEQDDNYTVFINVTDRKKLREELKDVEIVIIDEVSLLGQQLLAEIDHALRYAKNNNEYFGGVIIIFTGDFFQFPPVYQTPLYTPVNQMDRASDYELLRRLGRLAWKSITDVICLDEQQRMKEDPQYGIAVEHLRKRKCTQADVDLFNSRVIKSAEHPEGVDMSKPPYNDAVAIVSTNLLRETINMKEAIANCLN